MAKCAACGGGSGVGLSSGTIPTVMRAENMVAVTSSAFTKMVYVGVDGLVTTAVSGISYGTRSRGDVMYVHSIDLTASPELWASEEDYIAGSLQSDLEITEVLKPKRKTRKKGTADAGTD